MYKQKRPSKPGSIGLALKIFLLILLTVINLLLPHSQAQNRIEITPNFIGKELAPHDRIEMRLNQSLKAGEGSLAFILNQTDLTAFFVPEASLYSYTPKLLPLPVGEDKLAVYQVSPQGEWTLLREFTLQVAEKAKNIAEKTENKEEIVKSEAAKRKTEIEITPTVALNFKGESNVGFFPVTARPERLSFTDTAGQGAFQISVKRNGWTFGSQFNLAGSSRRQEALRFSELGAKASMVDLSSYQVQLEKGRFKAQVGHVSFGSQRHLINGFSSRGLLVTVPVGKQNEISLTALNGTSIVGFDNFIGVTRANHQVLGLTFAREFFKERPGGLRLELTAMRGSLLPLNGFNERTVTDAEKSFGGTVRLQFKDKSERLRFEGGFTRSSFRNPADPSLEQGQAVAPIRSIARNARFIEASYDFLKGLTVWKERKLRLTGTFRHEEIQPLFRSITASNQADRRQNQFEITGGLGEINFTFGNLRDRDNLNKIPSILETLNRRSNAVISVPLNSLFNPAKPVKWLPRLGYTLDYIHQFGLALPLNGEFNSLSQVPDQYNYSQNFTAEWALSDTFQFGYRHSRSFQDNRQPGRELADFRNISNALTVSFNRIKNVQLGFDLSRESAANLEEPRTDNNFRFGTNLTWQDALLKNLTFNTNFSTIVAGDRANTNDSQNIEYDAQVAYKFEFGKEKFKKMSAQVFVRYANRYGNRFDRLFRLNDFNKNQGFNMGINFNFF